MPGASPPTDAFQANRNRRIYARRRTIFPATYVAQPGGHRPGYGLDIGGGGVCLLTQERIPEPHLEHFALLAIVGERKVRFEAGACWAVPTEVRGKARYRYGLRMKQIADRDWDHVMQHSLAGPEAGGIALGTVLTGTQRDAILPLHKQYAIAALLVRKARLAVTVDSRLPLVEYTFTGHAMQRGIPYYKLNVRSKMVVRGYTHAEHTTSVLVAIQGDSIRVLD